MQVQVAVSTVQADTKGEKQWGDQDLMEKLPKLMTQKAKTNKKPSLLLIPLSPAEQTSLAENLPKDVSNTVVVVGRRSATELS